MFHIYVPLYKAVHKSTQGYKGQPKPYSIWQAVYSYLDRLLIRVICGNLVTTNYNVVQTCQFASTIEFKQPTQNNYNYTFGKFKLLVDRSNSQTRFYLPSLWEHKHEVIGKMVGNHLSNLSDKSRFNLGQP